MKPGVVIGRVWSTRKYETFEGKKLLLIQPTDWRRNPIGDPIVACDAVGAGAGEFVFYVGAREAAVAFSDLPPCDAAILGIIDNVNIIE
ncbi:MAG: EutN/CcmL family microcompartment protein [bacterium]|nr:EutN/CcmL family microcompartment protein [bacterium]